MSNWIKFTNNNIEAFGTTDGSKVNVYEGNIFDNPLEAHCDKKVV